MGIGLGLDRRKRRVGVVGPYNCTSMVNLLFCFFDSLRLTIVIPGNQINSDQILVDLCIYLIRWEI